MTFFVDAALSLNRKGRFLVSLLSADIADHHTLPEHDLVIMAGEDFSLGADQTRYLEWLQNPGRVLLLLPPFSEQPLIRDHFVDWLIAPCSKGNLSSSDPLVEYLIPEIEMSVSGHYGDSMPAHSFDNGILHTRYFRKYSNSGMLVVTCLPLWSITLLGHSSLAKDWLAWFINHAGEAKPAIKKSAEFKLSANDLNLLLCTYAFTTSDLTYVIECNKKYALFNLQKLNAHVQWPVLFEHGYLDDQGITQKGQLVLETSPYWPYACALKTQLLEGNNQ